MARTKREVQEPTRRSERLQGAKAATKAKEEMNAKVTKAKRFRRPRQRKTCRLLALPGELRNKIWRYTLVEPVKINVTTTGPGDPAVIRTCKSVRNEARAIYYRENDFRLHVRNYNGAAFLPFFYQYARWPKVTRSQVFFSMTGLPNWDNLVAWLKSSDTSVGTVPDLDNPKSSIEHIVGGAMRIVDAMKYLPWQYKEEALQGFYQGLKGTCSRWVKDEDRLGMHG
ncbi:hypothetical protein LTR37_019606 [Vermiconidia calcicola]|uniref:Uncharacterized protein n=1 Tax=Vermiconidia calcicola TaxID=1690605 RepID=A0ACC3MFM5_9PEZI|nr:hypothetical protein LTR37_019606 [Vermiconidia calcicola]